MSRASSQRTLQGGSYGELKQLLLDRQREITAEVRGKIRNFRIEASNQDHKVHNQDEISDVDVANEIEFALVQMKAETLAKINYALARLETGAYGYCGDCGEEIDVRRLRSLPFAVRCWECEDTREAQQAQARKSRLGFGSS